jgi:hypothetical protein
MLQTALSGRKQIPNDKHQMINKSQTARKSGQAALAGKDARGVDKQVKKQSVLFS